jgi:hypothetical protein
MSQVMSDPQPTPQEGIGDAFADLSAHTAALVRQEIDSAKSELLARLSAELPGTAWLAASGVLGLFAAASTYRLSLRLLQRWRSPTTAALIATLGYGGAAAYTGVTAVKRLRDAPLPVPAETAEQTATDVKHVVRGAAERVQGSGAGA